jgi:predicted PurR-regulated permease PerM
MARLAPHIVLALLLLGAAAVLVPFAAWLVLGAWLGLALRRFVRRVAELAGGRHRAAAAVTVASILAIALPLAAVLLPLAHEAAILVRAVASSSGPKALDVLVSAGARGAPEPASSDWLQIATEHGAPAWSVLTQVASAATDVLLGLLLFVLTTYHTLAEGERAWRWVHANAPFEPRYLERLAGAFEETGRGLFFGIGGAGLAQATIATAAYLALEIPRAVVLGVLTFFVSVIPSVGTALVWVPVAIGLAIQGRPGAAVALAAIGTLVVGTVDNLLRPALAHRAHLGLPSLVVLVAMLGGFALIGGWGLLLGPLVMRLAKEAVELERERSALRPEGAPTT